MVVLEEKKKGNARGEWKCVEALGANRIANVDDVNKVLGGCTNGRGHQLARTSLFP